MELKKYQQGVLTKLDRYLAVLREKREDAEAYVAFQKSRGKDAAPKDVLVPHDLAVRRVRVP